MKTEKNITRLFVKYSTLSALTLSCSILAIERPSPAAQPDEKIVAEIQENDIHKIPYLGVSGIPIPEALSTKLNLNKGVGLKIQVVAQNSPASKAGIKKKDVITSLADKNISNLDDLEEAMLDKKPGDKVRLTYISNGKLISKIIVLGARTVTRAATPSPNGITRRKQTHNLLNKFNLPKGFLNTFPKKEREMLMRLLDDDLKGLDLRNFQKDLNRLGGFNPNIHQNLNLKGNFNTRSQILDNEGSVILETSKNGTKIEIRDKSGKLQYSGPFNNKADKNKIPKKLRARALKISIKSKLNKDKRGAAKLHRLEKDLNNQLFRPFDMIEEMNQLDAKFKLLLDGAENLKQIGPSRFKSNSIISKTDLETLNRYVLIITDNDKQVEIYDAKNNLLYHGAYNTEIDKANVPRKYSDFLQKMNKKRP